MNFSHFQEKKCEIGKITFVTSFFHIYDQEYDERKTISWRIERFREIAATGIPICVYTCAKLQCHIEALIDEFPENVRMMKVMDLSDTVIAGMVCDHKRDRDLNLPEVRSNNKDVENYMIVIHSKTEFMYHAISENPWNSTHFAWIDFNISHVFFEKERSLRFLQWLGSRNYFEESCFVIPGCWDKWSGEHICDITHTIHWRFCGGFFMGDIASIRHFHELYLKYFPKFITETNTLTWEVNFWAWLEIASSWFSHLPSIHTWYKADHNDTIICDMWARTFSRRIFDSTMHQQISYDYPKIEGYNASSAAYLFHEGKHWLNTRYVNYWYYPNGWYMFYDGTNIIRTKNILSELKYVDDKSFIYPINYQEMNETIDLPSYEMYSRGIEDLRLYSFEGNIKYIATTVGYHSTEGNRMMIGEYRTNTLDLAESHLIDPPTNTFLEKNWVPLVLDNPESAFHGQELFIYKWGPFEVGGLQEKQQGIDDDELHLEIIHRVDYSRCEPFFHKMKGSANLVDTGDVLVGVVHFSEELRPRHYFHMLVEIDRTTMEPLRYSDPFYFDSVSIEFCIGFSIQHDNYMFWISRMDRDPLLVTLPITR